MREGLLLVIKKIKFLFWGGFTIDSFLWSEQVSSHF